VVTYGLVRFCLEFMRGDPQRPYYAGFSQGQWISLLLMCFVSTAEWIGLLPLYRWHSGVTAGLVVLMGGVVIKRRFRKLPVHRLLNPRHIKEVAEHLQLSLPSENEPISGHWSILPSPTPATAGIRIGCTSLGIRISAGRLRTAMGVMHHYAISSEGTRMTEETARVLARLIFQLKRAADSGEFVKGECDVFHLLIRPENTKEFACG